MKDLEALVDEKSILVNALWVMRSAPNMCLIEGDLRSKYAEVLCISDHEVYLDTTEHTLYRGKKKGPTKITFPTLSDKWRISMVTMGRYSINILLVKNIKGKNVAPFWETDRAP